MRLNGKQTPTLTVVSRRSLILAAPFVLMGANIGRAQESTPPKLSGPVLLTVDGDISIPNHGNNAIFDRAMLDELTQREFATSTIWTQDVKVFSGPTLQGILDYVGAGPGDIRANALNNYSSYLRRTEVTQDTPIIATRIDGMPFPVREKGPLWIVFPYDRHPSFRSELIYAMSVWQLESLTITPR